MVDSDDSENEFYDALFEFAECELNGTETTEKVIQCSGTNHVNKKLTRQSHRTIVLYPGISINYTENNTFGISLTGFLKIICGSILDNRLTSLFRKLTILSKLTSRNEKTLGGSNNNPVSNIVNVSISGNESISIDGKSREQVNIATDSSRQLEKSIRKEDQLTVHGIDFNFSDFKGTNSNNNFKRSSRCSLNIVNDISKGDSVNLISTESNYTPNMENDSDNSVSENTIRNQYSQTSGKSSDEETRLTITSKNAGEEPKQMGSASRNHREKKIKLLSTLESHRERKPTDRYGSLETIQETVFPVNEKLENDSTLHSNKQNISSSRNSNEYDSEYNYSDVADSPYKYYHRNVHAMRLDCPKSSEHIESDDELFQVKYNMTKKNKKHREKVIYNPLPQLEKLLELYTSHKINEELRVDSSSDTCQDEFLVHEEPEIFVELKRKSYNKLRNFSTPFLHSSSLPQEFCQNLHSEKNVYDSENDEHQKTTKRVRKKTFLKKKITEAPNDPGRDDSVKRPSRYHKRRKKSSATNVDDTNFKVTEIRPKNKSTDKNKNKKCRTSNMSKINSVMKNIFNI